MTTDVDEGFFNDLSRQPGAVTSTSSASGGGGDRTAMSSSSTSSPPPPSSSTNTSNSNGTTTNKSVPQSELPKTKRIACVICRKRKLKCDGMRPKCSLCARLGHNCAYDEVRRKSGPKRGYVKELEARLAQVETLMKSSDGAKPASKGAMPAIIPEENGNFDNINTSNRNLFGTDMDSMINGIRDVVNGGDTAMADGGNAFTSARDSQSPLRQGGNAILPEAIGAGAGDFAPPMNFTLEDNISWEMIGLGVEEPMPTQEAIDELFSLYFDLAHAVLPMIHRVRFMASMRLSPQMRPPVCLRYAMWALAAASEEKYMDHKDIFYRRARKYAELDEMKGSGEHIGSVAHAQTWALIASYEFKAMYFPRAWMSAGRGGRIANMLNLNRLDGGDMTTKQCILPPRDWIEREERRRTYWSIYCVDRYASVGTGWPVSLDDRDIATNLPSSEAAFELGTPEKTFTLQAAVQQKSLQGVSSFAGVCYTGHLFGVNLAHLYRHQEDNDDDNLQGNFWKRHRAVDNLLTSLNLQMPTTYRLPFAVRDRNAVFVNFAIHTTAIGLHQAAIGKAELYGLPQTIIDNSRTRCLMAASEIANLLKLTSHLDISQMNPVTVFCLYIGARVFIRYLKLNPSDHEAKDHLEFLLEALAVIRFKNPLSESFIAQLSLEIHIANMQQFLNSPQFALATKDVTMNVACSDPNEPKNDTTENARTWGVSSEKSSSVQSPGSLTENAVRYPSYLRKDGSASRSNSSMSPKPERVSMDSMNTQTFLPGDAMPSSELHNGVSWNATNGQPIYPYQSNSSGGAASSSSGFVEPDAQTREADLSRATQSPSQQGSRGITPQSSQSPYNNNTNLSSHTSFSSPPSTLQADDSSSGMPSDMNQQQQQQQPFNATAAWQQIVFSGGTPSGTPGVGGGPGTSQLAHGGLSNGRMSNRGLSNGGMSNGGMSNAGISNGGTAGGLSPPPLQQQQQQAAQQGPKQTNGVAVNGAEMMQASTPSAGMSDLLAAGLTSPGGTDWEKVIQGMNWEETA